MRAFLDKIPWTYRLWAAVAALGFTMPGFTMPGLSGASRGRSASRPASRILTRIQFTRCHDGDTCTGRTPEGLQITMRLLGLDAPEVAPPGRSLGTPQPFGLEARDELRRRVVGHLLPVELRGSDPYHRYLALIWEHPRPKGVISLGPSLNEQLVREGYAFAYRAKFVEADIRAWAERAEDEARHAKRGLWGLPEPPNNPAEYRHASR